MEAGLTEAGLTEATWASRSRRCLVLQWSRDVTLPAEGPSA
jgi:hypothetical protein